MNNEVLKKNIMYRTRCISGRIILFGKGKCFELNEIAYYIYKKVNGIKTVEEIIEDIVHDYSIEREIVELDVHAFVEEMKLRGVLKR